MTAGAEDVSVIIFNPAALAYGSGIEVIVGGTGLFTSIRFNVTGATTILGTPVSGTGGGNDGTQALLPNLYAAANLPGGFRLGLAVTSLYGLGSYWGEGWAGRYYALNSQLVTQDIVPTLSYRASPALSFGIGLDVEYIKVKTTSAIDIGTLDQTLLGGALGGVPGRSDGSVRTNAEGWGVGYILGALYEPVEGTRLGLSYRSQIRHSTRGDADFMQGGRVGQAAAAATGAFVPTGTKSGLNLPASVSLGVRQEIGANWTVMADLQWMGWHTLKSLQARFANPNQPPDTAALNWRDSWFATLGAKYRLNDAAAVRFGVAYDQTPTRDATRTPAIPDSDSIWASIGLEYRPTNAIKLDLAYGHIFVTNASVAQSAAGSGNALRGNLSGTLRNGSVDYVAAQASFKF